MSPATTSAKWYSGFQSALVAKWAIIWSVVADKLGDAFFHGYFETPATTWAWIKADWWEVSITGIMAVVAGGYVRAQSKANYLGQVEQGTAKTPAVPVVVPPTATVVTGDK